MKKGTNPTQFHLRNLLARIRVIRRKRFFVRATTGCAFAIAMFVGTFTAETVLDNQVDLPWIARAFALVGAVGGALFWFWRDTIQPLCKRMSNAAIASMIEYALPTFRTRYIASVQLSEVYGKATPPALVRALIEQTSAMAAGLKFGQVVKTRRRDRAMRSAMLALAVASGLAVYGGEASMLLAKRALLFNTPLPRKTTIVSITGDKKIGIGEDVKIELTARGVLPPGGRIIATSASKQLREFTLDHDPAQKQKYSATIRSPQESFTYYVKLNDAISPTYNVEALLRPAVVDVTCEITYPSYINLPPLPCSVGDLSLLVGSKLKVMVKANVKISKGSLHLEGLNKDTPLQVDAKDSTWLFGEFEIPPKDLTGFSVRLVNTDGVASGDSATYRIELQTDHEPTVKINYPTQREELATSLATLRIAFEAKDDFGIAKTSLHYKIKQGEEKVIDLDLSGRTEKNVTRQFPWKLASIQPHLSLGDVIEFWIVVADANNLTGPGVGTTEHYQTKIVSEEDKTLDIQNRMRNTVDGISDVTRTQEDLTKGLGEIIFQTNGNK